MKKIISLTLLASLAIGHTSHATDKIQTKEVIQAQTAGNTALIAGGIIVAVGLASYSYANSRNFNSFASNPDPHDTIASASNGSAAATLQFAGMAVGVTGGVLMVAGGIGHIVASTIQATNEKNAAEKAVMASKYAEIKRSSKHASQIGSNNALLLTTLQGIQSNNSKSITELNADLQELINVAKEFSVENKGRDFEKVSDLEIIVFAKDHGHNITLVQENLLTIGVILAIENF